MPGSGIWLDDATYLQTQGQMWAQDQQQRVQAGSQWAQQAMQSALAPVQDSLSKLQQMVPQVPSTPTPTPAPAAPPAPAPETTPIPTPPPTPPVPIGGLTPQAGGPPPGPGDLTTPGITPPPAPTPSAIAPVPTSAPTPSMADVGQTWAQQQISNLLNPSAPQSSSTATPTPVAPSPALAPPVSAPPSPVPSPLPDNTQAQGGPAQPTPAPSAATSAAAAPTPGTTAPPPTLGPIDNSSPAAFAKSFAPYAQYAAQKLGVDPTWVAAMAASESNYGKAAGNELFGIKALPGQPGTSMQTHEGEYGGTQQNATFASYNSPLDAVDAYVDLLKNHYQGAVGAQDLGTFVHGLKQGGYFTAAEPEYKGILQGISDRIGGDVQAGLQQAGSGIDTAKQAVGNAVSTGQTAVNTAVQAGQAAVARTSQFGMGLSSGDAIAFCGPAAAMAFAQTYGRNPTVDEAKQLAQQVGWNPDQGMAGAQSEVKLLNAMGVDAHMTSGVDWANVGRDASGGNPVIIDTPGHYYYVDGYNQQTGQLHVGTSGTDLKGGSEWMTPDQINAMPQSEGNARAAIFADHPLAQQDGLASSTAKSQTFMGGMQDVAGNVLANAPLPFIGQSANQLGAQFGQTQQQLQQTQNLVSGMLGPDQTVSSTIQNKAQDVLQAVQDVGGQATQAGQNLLQQTQQAIGAAPQTVSDMLNQNALTASGIPNIGGKALEGATNLLQQGAPLPGGGRLSDLTNQLGPAGQFAGGALPALQSQQQAELAQQLGVPGQVGDLLSSARQGDIAGTLGGTLSLGMRAVAPMVGGPEADISSPVSAGLESAGVAQPVSQILGQGANLLAPMALERGAPLAVGAAERAAGSQALRAFLADESGVLRLGPQQAGESSSDYLARLAGTYAQNVRDVNESPLFQNLLERGPSQEPMSPGVLRAIDQAAQARAAGLPNPQLAVGTFDELGRRIPSGAIENPLTSMELGQPGYDQYGVFQRGPLYSARGVAIDPLTGQEMVPPEEPGLPSQGQPPPAAAPQTGADAIQGLIDMAKSRGLDTSALEAQLPEAGADVPGGRQVGAINPQFATSLAGGAGGGLLGYNTADPNATPQERLERAALFGALGAGAGYGAAGLATGQTIGGIPMGDWIRGAYRGGIISAPSTMLDVAGTSTVMPVIQTLAGLGRDLATLQPGRAVARMQGTLTGLQEWIPTFLDALSVAHANPNSLVARAANTPTRIAAYAAEGAGMLHGAFQDATQNLIRQQELATGASPAAAAGVGARVSAGQELGTITSWLGRAASGGGPVTDALFPVYKKGMQLASRMVEASPLGAAGSVIDVAKGLVGRGPYAAGLGSTPASNAVGPLSERLVNNAMGTGLSILLAHQALEGNITGSWEGLTPAQQDTLRADGQIPDGVRIGGAWHSWDKLPPAVRGPFMAAGAYADAQHAYDIAQTKQGSSGAQAYGVEDPREAAAVALLREVGGQLVNQTPLKTFANTYDALTGGGGTGALYNAPVDMLSSILGGGVPASAMVRTAAQAGDPYQRQPLRPEMASQMLPAILQNVQQNIPGAREQLPSRVDVLGRDVANPQQGLGSILPMRAAAGQPSPVLQAMEKVGVAPSAPPQTIPYGTQYDVRLKPQEQQAWDQFRGQILQQAAEPLVTSPGWQEQSQTPQGRYLQSQRLKEIDARATTYADRQVLSQIKQSPDAGVSRRSPAAGTRLAPVNSYGPISLDPVNQGAALRNQLQQQALMQSLLGR